MKKKKKKIIIFIVIVIVFFLGYFLVNQNSKQEYDFVVVAPKDLSQEVNVTGQVKPLESLELGTEIGGRVKDVYVQIGDQIEAGQLLLALEDDDLRAQFFEAQATLESARITLAQYQAAAEVQKSKLEELKQGFKFEEIKITKTKVLNAEKNLLDAEKNLENVQNKAEVDLLNLYDDVEDILRDNFLKASTAINDQIDDIFSNDSSDDPQLSFLISDSQAKIDAQEQRKAATQALKELEEDINEISSQTNFSELDIFMLNSKENLLVIRELLRTLNNVLNSTINLSSTLLATYKNNVNSAQSNINTALSNINDQQQLILGQKITNESNISVAQSSVNSASNALALAEDELTLKQSGATKEQIEAQEALVDQANLNISSQRSQIKKSQAALDSIEIKLTKTKLSSPLGGIITKQEAKKGEIVSPNASLISVISLNNFKIEAYVPEMDIAQVKINDLAQIRLDAYGSEVIFEATLTSIDPAATVIEGIPTYKTTFCFNQKDDRVKSGMTADIDVLTEELEGVISVPVRSVFEEDGQKFVNLVEPDGSFSKVQVKTGIKGNWGEIEIKEGLKEGDKVVVSLRSN